MLYVEVDVQYSIVVISGSSSVGRATAFQAVGRGFEPRLPLTVAGVSAKAAQKRVLSFI